MADKVEKFAELIEDRQEDINEAVETFREIGRALESTGRETREKNNPGAVPDHVLSAETTGAETTRPAEGAAASPEPPDSEELNQDEESDEGLPPWLPWAVAGGAGIWGITRKPK